MTFFELITAAVADIEKYGYDSKDRLNSWIDQILLKLKERLTPLPVLEQHLIDVFTATYNRTISGNTFLKTHPGIKSFTINQIQPKLHAELQRRIMVSADLIKLNREDMITRTLQRFSGWATSIPPGGSKVTDTNDVKQDITKALKTLPFTERRVMIDQGHKFVSNLNNIIAVDGGAIAGRWHSHWRQNGYDYRIDHKERDDKYYAIRGNWALEKGLMNKGAGYTDEITSPGEEVYCRCYYTYIYSPRKLPADMLTKKGEEWVNNVFVK